MGMLLSCSFASLFALGNPILCRMGLLLGAWMPPLSLGVHVCCAKLRASMLCL